MNFRRYQFYCYLRCGRLYSVRSTSNLKDQSRLESLCKYLNLSEPKANYLCVKQPVILKLNDEKIKCLVDTVSELGFSSQALVDEPGLFGILPITLKFRYKVLDECGFENIKPTLLLRYLTLLRQVTIGDLKSSGFIPSSYNVENRLASYMTQWPTSLTTLIYEDIDKTTLYTLRLRIIQRYLELVLDLASDNFYRGLGTYPTIKHRPLEYINETINILQSQIMIPNHKIKSNMYLIHADPNNLKNIIYKLHTIGGIDVKEVIRLYPKIATRNYSTLVEVRNILEKYGINNEAQRRCFPIYTLGPETIQDRLERAKTIPEFSLLFKHPRFLKMIYYNTTASKRLMQLYKNNKKCISLNVLSGSTEHFEAFEKAPGDRLGKGKDLIFCITQLFRKQYSSVQIRNVMKRHPFWINTPVIQIKLVFEKLSVNYSDEEIYQNCTLLLYPWKKICETLNLINKKQIHKQLPLQDGFDYAFLSKSQKLSLALYLLERSHYFSGNGVWSDDKNRNLEVIPYNILEKNGN